MNTTKKLVLSGLFVALGVILPVLCHGIPNAGSVLLPMHIPLLAGLFFQFVHTGKSLANVYISLIGAMLGGRIVYGVINALIFRAGEYSLAVWATASFVTALPGIIIQLVLIPMVVLALRKAKLAPALNA